jgi:hypothetical protein
MKSLFAYALLPLLSAVALSTLPGCHSSSGAATPPGIYCRATIANETVCYGYSNLNAAEKTAVSDACTSSLRGTIGSSCPGGEMGCCTTSTAGFQTTECYYVGTASAYKSACQEQSGKWSDGSSGVGGGDAGSGGTGSDGGAVLPPEGDAAAYGPPGSCQAGQTQCPKGCVDEGSDVNNCGSCGYSCPSGSNGTTPICSAGKCSYSCNNPSETLCDDTGGGGGGNSGRCVDLSSSVDNCGQCFNVCQPSSFNATASCQQGVCESSCPQGQGLCGGKCIDIESNPSDCGACGVTCGPNTVCTSGSCVAGCQGGGTLCNTVCTSLQTDSANCGTCGNECPNTASACSNGSCTCEVYCVDQVGDPYCCKGGQQCYQNGCQ